VTGAPRWGRIQTGVRIGLAAVLGVRALAFLLVGRASFERLGYPDAARLALGGLEAAAAVLLVHPRTFLLGAIGLIGTLSWAAGFHFALRAKNWPLLATVALVGLLVAARSVRTRGEEAA